MQCQYDRDRRKWKIERSQDTGKEIFWKARAGPSSQHRAQVVLAGSRYNANCLEPHAHLAHLFTGLPKATTADQFEAQLPWNVSAACGA
jgi:hypothetical protein